MADSGDSWAVWLDEHGAALVLLARHWVPSQADAEDVVQEAFVRFWPARAQIDEPVRYLYAGVEHCALFIASNETAPHFFASRFPHARESRDMWWIGQAVSMCT